MLALVAMFGVSRSMSVDGEIIAYCDLFNTKLTGFFAVAEIDEQYYVFYYENTGPHLNTMGVATSPEVVLEKHKLDISLDSKPVAAYCQDFSKNNYNDLLLVTKEHNYTARFYFQTKEALFNDSATIEGLYFYPFPLSIENRFVADFVFVDYLAGRINYRKNSISDDYQGCVTRAQCFGEEQTLYYLERSDKFDDRALIYQVDVNGDCLTEFAAVVKNYSSNFMLFFGKDSNARYEHAFTLLKSLDIGQGIGIPYYFDINTNSNLDLLVPNCYGYVCSLKVFYNKGREICGGATSSGGCRPKGEICYSDPQWGYEATSQWFDEIMIDEIDLERRISIQDVDLQRYPTIFVPTRLGIYEVNTTLNTSFYNVRGVTLAPGVDNEELQSAEFANYSGVQPLDLTGRGWFVFAFTKSNSTDFFIRQKFSKIGFFLKAQMLTDLCFDKCGSSDPRRSYSTFFPGATFKYLTSDVSNTPKTGIMSVFGQPMFVELPYAYFGIATVSQYVDYFAAGTGRKVQYFSGIVPNSALWVVSSGKTWKVVVYLEDVTTSMISVSIAASIVLVCFCLLLMGLLWWQNKSDQKEAAIMNEYFE